MLSNSKQSSPVCPEHDGPSVTGRKRLHSSGEDVPVHVTPSKRLFSGSSSGRLMPCEDPFGGRATETSSSSIMAGMIKSRPAKSLGIKSFSVVSPVPASYSCRSWDELKESVLAILTHKSASSSQEVLFGHVRNICNHNMAQKLYNLLMSLTTDHVKKQVLIFQRENDDLDTFLRQVHDLWQQYCRQMVFIRSIFLALDRTYVVQAATVMQIWDASLDLFRQHIASASTVRTRLSSGLQALVGRERNGESVDRALLSSLVHMVMDLNMYVNDFEEPFLADTEVLYEAEGRRLVVENNMPVPEYLLHVDRRLKQEQERLVAYLDSSTRTRLIGAVDGNLIGKHVATILTRGFDDLLDSARTQDLTLLYTLFRRVKGGVDSVCRAFNDYAKRRGSAIVMNTERESSLVQDLLDLKDSLDDIICDAFEDSEKFVVALKDALAVVVNRRSNKPAELIAKFVDLKLRAGNKETTEEELDQLLDKVMVLFRVIQGKDFFEAFYQTCLAKRLLVGKSASVDAERSMLLKLKQECGPAYTNKMEGMFKDMDLSKEVSSSFRTMAARLDSDIELSVNILTRGHWPSFPTAEVNVLPQMARLQDAFRKFYISKRSGRKLTWQNTLGHCVLKATFKQGKKELQVSLFQTLVLCMYNDGNCFSFEHIQLTTGIEKTELRRILQSLACGKARVLRKEPKGKDVNDTDQFHFNADFMHKLYRIKVNQIQMKETKEENSNTAERVIQDRQYQIDAAVVRIMKMRKVLTHTELLGECFGQLKFPVKASDLKKRIENLIDRDYLVRSADNTQYHYQA